MGCKVRVTTWVKTILGVRGLTSCHTPLSEQRALMLKEKEKVYCYLRKEIMNKLVVDLLQQKGLGC